MTVIHTSEPEGGGVMAADLQALAKRHLWMHFTRMGAYTDADVPVIVRGEGCYVYDQEGRRYLDGLSALYCVNAGHGRSELGRPRLGRRPSSGSTRTGATRTLARSNWRRRLPSWRRER